MRTLAWAISAMALIGAFGCSDGSSGRRRGDSGTNASDSGGAGNDSGEAPPGADAGQGPSDSGAANDGGGAANDGGGGADAGTDAGSPSIDAGPIDCVPLSTVSGIERLGEIAETDPSWTRPDIDDGCPSTTLSEETTRYDTYCFYNAGSSAAAWDFGLFGDEEEPLTLGDPFLLLYAGAAFPADPLACLDANDDDPEPKEGTLSSRIAARSIEPGARVLIVATGFDADAIGTYRLTVSPSTAP